MEKITLYEKVNAGTSIDVLKQKRLANEGKRPLGVAFVSFDEAIDKKIYYTINRIIYFDTIRITVVDKFHNWNYLIYRISNNSLIYDPVMSEKGSLERGAIKEIRFSANGEETYIFYEGEAYTGKI